MCIKFIAFLLIITSCSFGCDKTTRRSLGIQSVVISHIVTKLNENGDKWYKCLKYDESILKIIPKVIADVYLKKNPISDNARLINQSHYNYVFLCALIRDKIDKKIKKLDDLLDGVYNELFSKYGNKSYLDKAKSDIKAYMTDLGINELLDYNLNQYDNNKCFFVSSSKRVESEIGDDVLLQYKYLSNAYIYIQFDTNEPKIIQMKLGFHEYNLNYKLSKDICLYDVIKNYNPKLNILEKFPVPGVETYLNSCDRKKITEKNQSFDKDGNVTVTYQWDKDAKNDYVEFTSDGSYDITGIKLTDLGRNFDKQISIVIEGDTYGHETTIAPKFLRKLQGCYDDYIRTNAKVKLIFRKKNNKYCLINHNASNIIISGYGIFRQIDCLTEVDLSGAIFVCNTKRNVLDNSYIFYYSPNLRKITWNKDVKTALSSAVGMFGRTALEEIDMSNFYASEKLRSISGICGYCHQLKKVNISSLSYYDKHKLPIIQEADSAFAGCTALEEVDLCDLTMCKQYDCMLSSTPQNVKLDKTKLPKTFKWELKDKY